MLQSQLIINLILCWCVNFLPLKTTAQFEFGVHTGGIYAFNHENPSLGEDEIIADGYGYLAGLDVVFHPDHWKFAPGISAGYKKLNTQGSVGEYDVSSELSKLIGSAYFHYLMSDSWKIGIIGMVENNKDFAIFRPKSSDLWRYNAGLDLTYVTTFGLGAFLRYTRCIYPNENIYLISNPSDLIFFGVSYKFLKL